MTDLILAVPSKGRLEENAAALFADAGVPLKRAGARGYQGTVNGVDGIELLYLSASEIAARLAEGSLHMGITGEDLLREEVPDMDVAIQLVMPLGFGRADVVVAIPDGWVDVTHMADLAEVASDYRARHGRRLRVATKYVQLTANFFAAHGVTDYVVVQSFGATEAAPNSGAAEAIVDITSTGATLSANALRVPEDGVMLKSEANLAAALKADWTLEARRAAKQLLGRLVARRNAESQVEVRFTATGQSIDEAELAPFAPLSSERHTTIEGEQIRLLVSRSHLPALSDWLTQRGLAAMISQPELVFTARNEVYERLVGSLV